VPVYTARRLAGHIVDVVRTDRELRVFDTRYDLARCTAGQRLKVHRGVKLKRLIEHPGAVR